MFTRAQYMNHECSFHDYYKQFVTPAIMAAVLCSIATKEDLTKKYAADEHLNNIPLAKWDRLADAMKGLLSIPAANNYPDRPEYAGKRFYSQAGGVCILKTAARMIILGEEVE